LGNIISNSITIYVKNFYANPSERELYYSSLTPRSPSTEEYSRTESGVVKDIADAAGKYGSGWKNGLVDGFSASLFSWTR
jgi:hypothetical protein